MMSFLTYITGFFMNFELLPILTDYEIKKKMGPKYILGFTINNLNSEKMLRAEK
jgi:hypothetical protein